MEQSPIRLHLRRFREARNLTQQDLADKIGCNRSYLALIECGDRYPTLPFLGKIASALGVQVRDLIDERPCPECPYWEHTGVRLGGTPIVSSALEAARETQQRLIYEVPRRTAWRSSFR
jgi:transcriptional regulator with XRE-family HTH domain